jgi:hypothetical protein
MGTIYASIGVPRFDWLLCTHPSIGFEWLLSMHPLEFQGLNGYYISILWGLGIEWLLFMHPLEL